MVYIFRLLTFSFIIETLTTPQSKVFVGTLKFARLLTATVYIHPPAFFYKGLVASISVWQDTATVVGTNGCLLLFESLLLSRYFFAPCFGLDQLVARLPFRSDRNVPPELVSTLCSITTEQNWLKLNLAKAYYYFSIQMGSFLLHTSPPPNTLHKLTPLQFLLFWVLKACKSSHCDRINTRWQRLASVVLIVGPYKVAVMCSLQFRVL